MLNITSFGLPHLKGRFGQFILLIAAIMWNGIMLAQFDIQMPVINTGAYAITDTIYMDPNGEDSNPGTYEFPVKTFSIAVQKLPYGTQGINGGNAYGLIMLKPGYYPTHS